MTQFILHARALDYRDEIHQFGMTTSRSRRGNCYDNAPMESFWATLKNELMPHRRSDTPEKARRELSEDISISYDRQRQHSRIGNHSPLACVQQ